MVPAFDLTGRTVLITGASSGIGERWARLVAAAGANVVMGARRTGRLEAIRDELVATGKNALAVAIDVADEASVKAAFDAAEAAFGPVETVLANAGVSGEGQATELSLADFDQATAINLRGVFITAREGARRMIAAGCAQTGRGRIVITASITAFKTDPGLAAYSATKAGVVQMGKVLAREWIRKGINVNMICPGYIKTEINSAWFDTEAGAKQVNSFPRRRLMQECDLDVPLLFLASDMSQAVTGTSIVIDDGQSI